MGDAAALAGFTPVSLALASGAASIDWGDLTGWRFSDPFFDQTVERWAGSAAPRLARTGLDALEALDETPSLDPAALIFHLSRCGSTLVSRLLSRVPGMLVVAEPKPVNTLLLAGPAALGEAEAARLLRLLVRALGRRRFGDEQCYALKLSSWNVARLDLFRRAFPEAKLIWVQRRPIEVMASLIADPPGWLALRGLPQAAERLFGMAPEALRGLDAARFCAHALAALLAAARAAGGARLAVDYRDLPEAVWTRIAPFIGVDLGESEIALLREEARYHAKDPGRRLFSGDPPGRAAPPDALRALVEEKLEPLYRAIESDA
ncbi:MAG TPA: hypothetical protein VEI03_23720 [Stellaceae bacterium]|nr:hypothetical protein [Stellaceae bacterium]